MKKKLKGGGMSQCLQKNFLVMRITLFLILVSSAFSFSSNSYSQNVRLSLHMDNVVVKDVLMAIENQSEFIFFYQDQNVDLERKVDIQVEGKEISEILDQLFNGSSNVYTIRDRQIIIGEIPKQLKRRNYSFEEVLEDLKQAETRKISGTVYDDDGLSIPGASIIIKGTTKGTVTNNDGAFSLDVEDNSILLVSFIGYESKEVEVGMKTVIHITLSESVSEIEDVTVVAFAKQKKRKCNWFYYHDKTWRIKGAIK